MAKIPTYGVEIESIESETPAVNFVALVDFPAIEKGWQMFGREQTLFKATPEQKERRIITGPLMLADTPIYRNTPERGEFYVVFTKENIEQIVKKFAKGNYYNNVNMMHVADLQVGGISMIESFIIDEQRGIKTPSLFDKAPNGSWFASYFVENDVLWNEYIMKGKFTGFSVECFMNILFNEKFQKQDKADSLETAFVNMAKALKTKFR